VQLKETLPKIKLNTYDTAFVQRFVKFCLYGLPLNNILQ